MYNIAIIQYYYEAMPHEKFGEIKNPTKHQSNMAIGGFDEHDVPIYEEMKDVLVEHDPKTAKAPPHREQIFDRVIAELNMLKEQDDPIHLNRRDFIQVAINSTEKVGYQILDARKGYYVLGRNTIVDDSKNTFLAYSDPRTIENPDIIVCSGKELKDWMTAK